MNFQIVTVVAMAVICGVLSVGGSPAATYIQAKANQSLMKYMTKARATSGVDSIACFNYYIPLLNGIADTYKTNYEACLDTENSAIDKLIEQGSDSRNSIISSSNEVCARFNACQAETDILNFFDCYSNTGDENTRQIYAISQNANEQAADYRESYRTIKITCERCTNDTQRAYVSDTANAYDELDLCLENGLNIPTTTQAPLTSTDEPVTGGPTTVITEPPSSEPSTEAPSTEAPSTEAPSTEAPSTAAPSTEAPSTEAPSTEAPSTEAPSTEAPSTEAPSTEAPSTEAPSTEAPSTEAPSSAAPSSEAPSTEAPSSAAPSTEAPSSAAPSSEATESTTVEQDQVEELIKSDNSVRSRLEQLVKNWRQRLA